MSFTTPIFLIFLALAALGQYLLPGKLQNLFLLLASLVFYMWAVPEYGVLVLFTAGLCYGAGILLARLGGRGRKAVLWVSLLTVLGMLFTFKYYNFFIDTLSAVMGLAGVEIAAGRFGLALPVGISFYTFQVVGYLLDVYHGNCEAERDFVNFALFVSFFPAILSGPIGRAKELLPQYRQRREFSYDNLREGLQRFLTGAFRKVVLADGIGQVVSRIYGSIGSQTGPALLAAVLLYSLEIYYDFSGYSDMAIGAARVLGIKLRENFAAPYLATDMGGLWKRWHMSLTTWLQDYIFTPLVWSRWANKLAYGRRWDEKKPAVLINILIVFLISGVWHGAGLGYIVWGALHGLFRVCEELAARWRKKRGRKLKPGPLRTALGRAKVFLLTAFAHLFFGLTLGNARLLLSRLTVGWGEPSAAVGELLLGVAGNIAAAKLYYAFYIGVLALGFALVLVFDIRVDRSLRRKGAAALTNPLATFRPLQRWLICFFMEVAVVLFYLIGSGTGASSFIYFGY